MSGGGSFGPLTCDGWCEHSGEVAMIDQSGFAYCEPCGMRRRESEPCRKVRRVRIFDAKVGWTGPIRSERQAGREQAAWESCGWTAEVLASTPAVKAEVRAWQRAKVTA